MKRPDSLRGLRVTDGSEERELQSLFEIIARGSPRVFPEPAEKGSLGISLRDLEENRNE